MDFPSNKDPFDIRLYLYPLMVLLNWIRKGELGVDSASDTWHMEELSGVVDPLVGDLLVANQHRASSVQGLFEKGAIGMHIVPVEGTGLLGGDGHIQNGEGRVATFFYVTQVNDESCQPGNKTFSTSQQRLLRNSPSFFILNMS